MGRKSKNTVQFFPHFVKEGKTIYILERNFGIKGYVFWFKLLELLGSTEDHYVDFKDVDTREYFLAKTQIENDLANEILEKLAQLGQIDKDLWSSQIIWSQNFVENLSEVYRKRKRPLPQKPELKDINNKFLSQAVAENTQGDTNLSQISAESTHSRVEDSRVDESIIEESKEKEKESLEFLRSGSIPPEVYFQSNPHLELDIPATEIVQKMIFTRNPESHLKPKSPEIATIKSYLLLGGTVENIERTIEGAEISDKGKTTEQLSKYSEKRNLNANYIADSRHQLRLIGCWDIEQGKVNKKTPPSNKITCIQHG